MSALFLQAIFIGIIGYFALVWAMLKYAPVQLFRGFSVLSAVLWLGAVAYLTILMRCPILETRVHMTPFVDARLFDMMQNAVLFLPFGSIFGGLFPRVRARWCVLAGVCASLAIELVQLLSHRGICDIDDWIANSVGVVLGALLFAAARRLARRPSEAA